MTSNQNITWKRIEKGMYQARTADATFTITRMGLPMGMGHEWMVTKKDQHANRVLAIRRYMSVKFPDATRPGFTYLKEAKEFVAEQINATNCEQCGRGGLTYPAWQGVPEHPICASCALSTTTTEA